MSFLFIYFFNLQVKDMLVKSEIENKRSVAIINEYKQICKRQDEQLSSTKAQLEELRVSGLQNFADILNKKLN